MQRSLQAMQTALRILSALTEKREPDATDVSELERYIGPKPNAVDLDEWVCNAITKAIKHRTAAREASGGRH